MRRGSTGCEGLRGLRTPYEPVYKAYTRRPTKTRRPAPAYLDVEDEDGQDRDQVDDGIAGHDEGDSVGRDEEAEEIVEHLEEGCE